MKLRLILTTAGNEPDAEKIARTLIEEKLAACVNVVPLAFSVYRWKGRIEKDPELLLVIKTADDRVADLKARLRALHPYETPEIVELAAESVSEAYLAWVVESTRK